METLLWPDAGPSRPCGAQTARQPPSHDGEQAVKSSRRQSRHRRRTSHHEPPSTMALPSPAPITPRRRRPPRKPGLALVFLPLLPLASAAPPPVLPPQITTPPIIPREAESTIYGNFRRETRDSELPEGLPTDFQVVEETSLPYILKRDANGVWSKSEQGWKLYGRASGVSASIL